MYLSGEDRHRGIQSPCGAGFADQRRPVLERGAGYLDFGGLGVASEEGDQAEQYRYDNGRAHSGYDVVEWAKRGVALGAGEILLTSVDNEGLQQGMDLELIEAVTKAVNVPVICGGGVGCGDDIVDAANAGADAVACAAVLHYKKETVTELKEDIRAGGVEVRRV